MEISRHWRLRQQRYSLVGEICPHCEAKIFPPRDVCPECGNEARTPYAFSGRGEVYSFSTIYDAPAGDVLGRLGVVDVHIATVAPRSE